MIGSVFEQRDQLAALERRRQEVAAQQAPAVAASVAAPLAASAPATGNAPAAALKAAEPHIAKRRKAKDRGDLKGRELKADPLTDAHESAQAGDGEHAAKNFAERGITAGPGDSPEPGHPEADRFQRPYESEGHASESPLAGAPRQMPIIHAPQGYVQPIELPGALGAGYVPAHVTQALSMGSPSER